MPPNVRNKVDSHSTRPFIVEIAVQAAGAQLSLEFFAQQGRRLAAAGVAGALGAEKDEGAMG